MSRVKTKYDNQKNNSNSKARQNNNSIFDLFRFSFFHGRRRKFFSEKNKAKNPEKIIDNKENQSAVQMVDCEKNNTNYVNKKERLLHHILYPFYEINCILMAVGWTLIFQAYSLYHPSANIDEKKIVVFIFLGILIIIFFLGYLSHVFYNKKSNPKNY